MNHDVPASAARRVAHLVRSVPLVDGHNDLPWIVRKHTGDPPDADAYPLAIGAPGHTDLVRLRKGGVGAQFWAIYLPCDLAGPGVAALALEQFDLLRRLEARFPDHLQRCWSAAEVEAAFARGRIASLVGVEGGHLLEDSLEVLKAFRELGARYLTLTHNCSHGWADSAADEARHGGLSGFGREVVRELNRLGMLVDLSHASDDAARHALETSAAPVVYTHASARALCDHVRNVPDDLLQAVRECGGVVMVTFVPAFVSEEVRVWYEARKARGVPYDAPLEEGAPRATLSQVADHVEHVRKVAGVEHVGLGGDFDGTAYTPLGLEDVATYPRLLAELVERGWSDEELTALAGGNALRVLRRAEAVADEMGSEGV